MLPTQPAGSRHASQPLPPCGEPGKRGNSRAHPDGDDEYSGRRGDHPPKPMGIIDSQATKEKKKKKKKSAGPITDLTFLPNFWCATDLSTLPELVGKSASGVYDALQNGKDLELRSTRETLCWPDGHLSSLRDLLPDSLFVYSEYDPSCNRDRRIVLQVGKGGTSPLGTNVYASRGAAVAAGGDRVCPPSLVAHLLDTGVAVGTPPLSEAWGTATYAKAGFGSGSCFLLEVAPVGLLMARTTDLRPSNKSPTKKKEPRQASRSPESVADLPPPKARRNLGLDPLSDPIANLEKELKAGADRPTAAAELPMGATAEVEANPGVTPVTVTKAAAQKSGGKAGIDDVEGSIECARCGLEMTSDAELKKHLKNEHGLEVNDQELADMAFAPCPVPGCNTIHSLKGATVGVTPLYRHLQQYSNKVNLDGHEEHIKYMHSSDGGTSGELYQEAAVACRLLAQRGTEGERLNVKKARSKSPPARPKPAQTAALPPTVKPTPPPSRAPSKGSSRAASTALPRGRRPVGSLDVTREGDDTVDPEDDETQDDEPAVKITAKETTPRDNYNVDAFKDVDLDRLKAASLFHQEPPKSTEAAGAVMQPMVFAWKALARAAFIRPRPPTTTCPRALLVSSGRPRPPKWVWRQSRCTTSHTQSFFAAPGAPTRIRWMRFSFGQKQRRPQLRPCWDSTTTS